MFLSLGLYACRSCLTGEFVLRSELSGLPSSVLLTDMFGL